LKNDAPAGAPSLIWAGGAKMKSGKDPLHSLGVPFRQTERGCFQLLFREMEEIWAILETKTGGTCLSRPYLATGGEKYAEGEMQINFVRVWNDILCGAIKKDIEKCRPLC